MKNKEFYRTIEKEVLDHIGKVNPKNLHILKDLKITSLEQALGVFRAILELNVRHHDDALEFQRKIDEIMEAQGVDETDLDMN